MTWTDNFVDEFNFKEKNGDTDLLVPCLTKVGQNCFDPNTEEFAKWLESLNSNALYKSLLAAHTAMELEA